jgi:hypothetical protein
MQNTAFDRSREREDSTSSRKGWKHRRVGLPIYIVPPVAWIEYSPCHSPPPGRYSGHGLTLRL